MDRPTFIPYPKPSPEVRAWCAEVARTTGLRFVPLPPEREKELKQWTDANKRIAVEWERTRDEETLREQAAKILEAPAPKLREPRPGDWKTYLISVDDSQTVKIGIAKDPKARMATLQTGHPMKLSLLWTFDGDYERELHEAFARLRVRGEWFDLGRLGGDPVQAVRAVVAAIEDRARQLTP
jgi:hypothetical protein